jgi:hypothetical protein
MLGLADPVVGSSLAANPEVMDLLLQSRPARNEDRWIGGSDGITADHSFLDAANSRGLYQLPVA